MWWDTSATVLITIISDHIQYHYFPGISFYAEDQYAVEIFQTLDEIVYIFIALYLELEGMTANKMQKRVVAPYLHPTEGDHGYLRFFYIPRPNVITPKNTVALSAL